MPDPLIDDRELMGVLPVPSRAWHLQQLQAESAFCERLVRHQPSLARISGEAFQQALDRQFPALEIDPDTVWLLEELPSGVTPRSMTQAMQEALVSGAAPLDSSINGFSAIIPATGHQSLLDIDPESFVEVLNQHLQGLFEHFRQHLDRFWYNPVRQGNELTSRDTWLRYRQGELAAEAALRRADNLADPTVGLTADGWALARSLLAEQSQPASDPPKVAMFRLVLRGAGQDINLSAAFVLAWRGGLTKSRPVLLYTPQRGLEEFASDSAILAALSLRQAVAGERDEILVNVAQPEREQVLALRRERRAYWGLVGMLPDARGSLLGQVLDEQLAQQRVNARAAFLPVRSGIDTRVAQVLALPTGLPGDLLRRPLRPDTLPVVPSAGIAVGDQQQNLIRQINKLNRLTGQLLAGAPGFDGFFQQQLKTLFPCFSGKISPLQIYFTRSRPDGQPYASQTLESLLDTLWEGGGTDDYADGAFYVEPNTLDEGYRLQQVGTPSSLVMTLKQQFAGLLGEFWSTAQRDQGAPVDLLTRVRKQILATESALRTMDGTLTSSHRQLIDEVLKYPTAVARELAFPLAQRPRIYSLTLTGGERFATAFMLSSDSVSPPSGPLVLWTVAQGFEAFSSLGSLNAEVGRRLDEGAPEGLLLAGGLPADVRGQQTGRWTGRLALVPEVIEGDFVAYGVEALLSKQQRDLRLVLEADNRLRPGTVDRVIDLAPQLDTAPAFVVRNQLLEEQAAPGWQKALAATDRERLQEAALAAQEKNQALAALLEGLESLHGYARQKLRGRLRDFLEARGLPGSAVEQIDPDKIIVVRTEAVRVTYVSQPGVTPPVESVYVERMGLTELTLKNLKPWEGSIAWTSRVNIEASLTYADGRRVFDVRGEALKLSRETIERWVKEIDAGHHYCEDVLKKTFAPPATSAAAERLAQAWMAGQAATLEYAAQSARLNPAIYKTVLTADPAKKRAQQWVEAVLAAWAPAARPRVEGRAVVANILMLGVPDAEPERGGSQWVQGLVVISTAEDAERVLYAPNAPDGLDLRELAGDSELIALLGRPQWRAYLLERLCVKSQQVIESLVSSGLKYQLFAEGLATFFLSGVKPLERLPPLNVQLVPCRSSLLQALYYLQVFRLVELAQRGANTNAQVSRQSTFNKLMFGVEVAGMLLDMLPWGLHWVSSIPRLWSRLAHSAVGNFRARGQAIPGLVLRDGPGGWRLGMDAAIEGGEVLGVRPLAIRSAFFSPPAVPARSLLQASRPPTPAALIPEAWKASAVPRDEAAVLLRGLEPNAKGIYRTQAGEYLIRPVDRQGNAVVLRIKSDFKLYGEGGLTVQVIDAQRRTEVGFLRSGRSGHWHSIGVRGAGKSGSKLSMELPVEEYLTTDQYRFNSHGFHGLPASTVDYYDAWFVRDRRRFFETMQIPPRPEALSLGASATVDDLIRGWPESVQGLVLGENHAEKASVTFLTDKMQALYDRGFRTLYIEGSHATGSPMLLVSPGSVSARSVVSRRAQACGLRVRGLDDDYLTLRRDRYTGRPSIDMSSRIEDMNYFAVRQIQAYHPEDGGRWIAWVGAAHMNTTDGVPGIAELTGGIGVRISDARAGQPTVLRAPGRRGWFSGAAAPDVEIELDVTHSPARRPEGPDNL